MTEPTQQIRVRKIINYLNTLTRNQLKSLLPKGVVRDETIKEIPNVKYPTGLLSVLPKDESYSTLGRIAESMLQRPSSTINLNTLLETTAEHYDLLSDADRAKVTKSVTTQHFIDRLVATRQQLEEAFDPEDPVFELPSSSDGRCVRTPATLEYEPTVNRQHVQGHPDIKTSTKVFEVKLTGQVQENWLDFLFQAFAYAAICPEVREVNIVLPLQNLVWSYNVADGWPKREEYFALLERLAVEYQTVAATNQAAADIICRDYCIGRHISKAPGAFLKSIQHIKDRSTPYQLFLSSNMSSRISIKEEEIAPVAAHIAATGARIFIHAPYIINLCSPEGESDDYHTNCLIAITRIAARMGCRGVIVHVGKTTTRDPVEAMASMRANLLRAAEAATPQCPILLETPAGQGTETLQTWEEFFTFVNDLADERIRVCIDTCHIFVCGHDPVSYTIRAVHSWPGLVQLIHYNDSLVAQGARLDRHAFMGAGYIGLDTMKKIAEIAAADDIPCVIEI